MASGIEETVRNEDLTLNLTVISLSLGAPDDTAKTLTSVKNQTIKPRRHLIVDSSESDTAIEVEKLCQEAFAEYLWVPPLGIYAAMRASLRELSDTGYCIFLNSGDRFAHSGVLEIVRNVLLSNNRNQPDWAIGGLISTREKTEVSRYMIPANEANFGCELRKGSIWLPHPSTIYRTTSLKNVHPFEDNFRIASDYATGLRMFRQFGAPVLIRDYLSIFELDGVSSNSPIRVGLENARARLSFFGPTVLPRELLRLFRMMLDRLLIRICDRP